MENAYDLKEVVSSLPHPEEQNREPEEVPVPPHEKTPEEKEVEAQIRSALNQQTIVQYRQYALEQHPKETYKQEELIRQLQEQYFQLYVNHIYKNQMEHQKTQIEQIKLIQEQQKTAAENGPVDEEDLPTVHPSLLLPEAVVARPLEPASMWTRKDLVDFKQEILRSQKECCIKIGSLATANICIPTHPDGSCIFWEFATDYYDIGFGVHFEWSLSTSDKITVHISESSDDELDEEAPDPSTESGEAGRANDVTQAERGNSNNASLSGGNRLSKRDNGRPTDELIPVYRRDSHMEVYCGSHQYPGRGVYVLKFDNSYSLWRSKWIYYRIYYTK